MCSTLKVADIASFHEKFYASREKCRQDAYLLRYCRIKEVKRRRPKTHQGNKPHSLNVQYYIKRKLADEDVPVCRTAFLQILNISKHRILGVLKRFKSSSEMPKENRGGDHRSHKSSAKRNKVIAFIKSFTVVETHYCRGKSTRQYLPSDLSAKKMWRIYNINNPDLPVKECFFRYIFNTKFNLGFNSPQTDVCSRCLQFTEKIKHLNDSKEKQNLMTEQRIHKLRSKAFFEALQEDKPSLLIISYDCQKNLPLPKIPDQQAYYKRQLYVYNFCIVVGNSRSSLKKDNVFMYTWKESDSQKGSNEIASAIFHRLQQLDLDGISSLRLCSDGCGGQNKNIIVISMASSWMKRTAPNTLKTLELLFPVTGHSYIPPDRVFANIEKKIRRKDTIIRPEEYFQIFEESGNVLQLGVDWFAFDWKSACAENIKTTSYLHFKINSCKRIIITRTPSNDILVQGEPNYKHLIGVPKGICKKGKTLLNLNPDELDLYINSIKPEKLKNVNELLTGHFGLDWKDNSSELGLDYYKAVVDRPQMDPRLPQSENSICEEPEDDNRFI